MATCATAVGSDEEVKFKCGICLEKNISREAEKHCVECQAYYCIPCSDMHKMFPLMKGHKLLDKASFDTSLPCFPTELCSVHKDKLLEIYCRDHDEVVCAKCVALDHRTCQDVHSISDVVDTLSAEVIRQLHTAKNTIDDLKQAREILINELKKNKKKAIDSIITFRMEMEAVVKKLEKQSIKEVEEAYEIIESKLQKEIKEVGHITDDLETYANKLNMSDKNKAQKLVCIKASMKIIKKMKEAEDIIKERKKVVEINFLINPQIQTFLQQEKPLGQVTTNEIRSKPKTIYTVKEQKMVYVKQLDDEYDCRVLGSCFTRDGFLLLADTDNWKLKLVDLSTEDIEDHLDLKAGPLAICLTGKHEAAVSLSNKTIQFVSLKNNLSATRYLKLDHFCYGLANKDNKLFISNESKAVTMLHKITTDSSDNPIFSAALHTSVSSDGQMVFVADHKKGLIILDTDGHYDSTFTDRDVAHPHGVCVDGRGNMFICGWGSSAIIQINEKSKAKLSVLGKVKNSLSACFNPQHNQLIVTLPGNLILVLELNMITQ